MKIRKIDGGQSSVDKFLIESDFYSLVFRLYNQEFFLSKIKAVSLINEVNEYLKIFPVIHKYGYIENTDKAFMLIDYVEGESLDKLLEKNPEEASYYASLVADKLLELHNFSREKEDLSEVMLNKIVKRYNKIKDKIPELDIIINFVKNNYKVLENRETVIVHGDLYPGNIVIKDNEVMFIDIDMVRRADPFMDLATAATDKRYYKFYSSLINSYYKDKEISNEEYLAYMIYACYFIIDYCVFAERNNLQYVDIVSEFLNQNNDLKLIKPKWLGKR